MMAGVIVTPCIFDKIASTGLPGISLGIRKSRLIATVAVTR